jgi:DNA excision repair protein ERCC-2
MSKRFLRAMAQPFDINQTGVSLWSVEDVEARQAQLAQATATDMQIDQQQQEERSYFEGLEDSAAIEALMEVEAQV